MKPNSKNPIIIGLLTSSLCCIHPLGTVVELKNHNATNNLRMTRRAKLAEATDKLNRLVQNRFELMPAVAHYKWHSGKPIEDLEREQVLLVQVAELAESQGACPDAASLYFQGLIDQSKIIQRKLHESWKTSPPDHKSADIDLLRKEIDSLTPRILRAWIHLLEVESSEITLTN